MLQDLAVDDRMQVVLDGAFFIMGPGGSTTNINKRRYVDIKVLGPDGREMFNEMKLHREKQLTLELRGNGLYSLW